MVSMEPAVPQTSQLSDCSKSRPGSLDSHPICPTLWLRVWAVFFGGLARRQAGDWIQHPPFPLDTCSSQHWLQALPQTLTVPQYPRGSGPWYFLLLPSLFSLILLGALNPFLLLVKCTLMKKTSPVTLDPSGVFPEALPRQTSL